jgi:hypothetical protein
MVTMTVGWILPVLSAAARILRLRLILLSSKPSFSTGN